MPTLNRDALDQLDITDHHQQLIATLVEKICDRLGDEIRHLSVYGSAARGEWIEGTSDINVLGVFKHATFDGLSQIGSGMAEARRKAHVVPMIVSTEELRRAADVYCVKFESIRQHYVTLAGDDALGDLKIDESNIRFVCEFQLRNVAMRMRQFYLQSFGQQDIEQEFLLSFFNSSLFPLRALARLDGQDVPDTVYDTFDAIGSAVGSDPSVLDDLARIRRERPSLDETELERLYENLNRLVRRAVKVVDRLEP